MIDPAHNATRSAVAARLALVVTCAVLAIFVLSLFGTHFWVFDLLTHFRVQYAFVLALCALLLFMLRRPRSALLPIAAAAVVSATVVSYSGWPSQSAQAATSAFRFVTFNRYFGNQDFGAMGEWLEQSRADVIALQEIDSMATVQRLAGVLPSYPHIYAQLNDEDDVAIFSRWPIRDSQAIELSPHGAQAAKTVVDWDGRPVTLIGVHLHWPMGAKNSRLRNAELRQLAAIARDTDGPLLIGGDFNITPWSPAFRAAVAESGLADCAKGHGLLTTWPAWFAPAAIRIDHCLASDHWRVMDLVAGPALGSDHRVMINDLELKN